MCTPSCMDRLFINLKVLSELKPGQKLYTEGDYLVLDDGLSYKQIITRWWLNETREKTLKKIQEVIRSSIYCGQNAINSEIMSFPEMSKGKGEDMRLSKKVEVRQWEMARDKYLQMDNRGLLRSLVRKMESSLVGLKNLKDTYKDDATICAKLDLESELVERQVERFSQFLEKPKEKSKS